jgi:hypothetical protein
MTVTPTDTIAVPVGPSRTSAAKTAMSKLATSAAIDRLDT